MSIEQIIQSGEGIEELIKAAGKVIGQIIDKVGPEVLEKIIEPLFHKLTAKIRKRKESRKMAIKKGKLKLSEIEADVARNFPGQGLNIRRGFDGVFRRTKKKVRNL